MQSHGSAGPLVPIAWADVLENVEKTLARAEAEAARGEESLGLPENPEVPPGEPIWKKPLDRLDERFRQMQGCLAEAELNASQAEGHLRQSEAALQHWQAQAAAMRQKLANGAVPPVS
jgi:hypothetical protein